MLQATNNNLNAFLLRHMTTKNIINIMDNFCFATINILIDNLYRFCINILNKLLKLYYVLLLTGVSISELKGAFIFNLTNRGIYIALTGAFIFNLQGYIYLIICQLVLLICKQTFEYLKNKVILTELFYARHL